MGLFDRLRAELVDIIEWVDDSQHTLVWRYPRFQNEIKNGAQLIVRPGQMAVLVDEGKLADVFEPGTYELSTANVPVLSTLRGWKHGFESPFKVEVYFVKTTVIPDLKWGTPHPVLMRDADFGPVRVRAFGTFALRAMDPKILVREVVGTDGSFQADEITELLRSMVVTAFAEALGKLNVPVLDLAAHYREIANTTRGIVAERIDDEYGLELPELLLVNVSLPPEVEKAVDTRSSMGALGNMQTYQQYQMANALAAAAQNPSGGAALEGMGMGMGMAMAHQMAHGMPHMGALGAAPPPPPPPAAAPVFHVSQNGQTQGPLPLQQIAAAIAQGQINAQTLVWCQGMAGWTPAGQVPQLAGYFGPPPPPPPPPGTT